MQTIIAPFTHLKSTKGKFTWRFERQKHENMKTLFENNFVFYVPNLQERFIVLVYGSEKGFAGCLFQRDANGDIRPVAFFSKQVTEAYTHPFIYEIKFISLVNTTCRFRHFCSTNLAFIRTIERYSRFK